MTSPRAEWGVKPDRRRGDALADTLAARMAGNTALTSVNVNEITEITGVRECLQFFTREKQWINEVHLEFCRVPAPTFMEGERAAWFLDRFRSLGWDAGIDRAGNVTAVQGSGPYIALTAHLDTVLAPRSKDDVSVDAEGRFRGPGVSDNGAGLAALLAIAKACKASRLPDSEHGLLLVANTGEEGEGNLLGMRHLCRQSPLCRGRWREHRPHHDPCPWKQTLRSFVHRPGGTQLERLRGRQSRPCALPGSGAVLRVQNRGRSEVELQRRFDRRRERG